MCTAVGAGRSAVAGPEPAILPPGPSIVPRSPVSSALPYVGDLDGTYLWLGVNGAATRLDDEWDSVFGGQLTVLRFREHARVALLGAGLAGGRVATEGWRVALDALVGTRIGSRATVGLGLGPMLDLHDARHARAGASATLWAFVGITPFVRAGVLQDGSTYLEIGAQLGLPILRF